MKDKGHNPLKVEIETVIPSIPFWDAQKELVATGKRFSSKNLKHIPYSQLHLCCIGPAGSAVCNPHLVYSEKERRLGRYVALAPNELDEAERWLRAQGMLEDVIAVRTAKSAPYWHGLKPRQKVVMKLLCLCNHWYDPEYRITEAVALIQEAAGDGIPPELGSSLCSRLVNVTRRYLGIGVEEKDRIADPEFRDGVWRCMEAILDLLPREEQTLLLKEQVQGYSCTSDCFRVY